MLCTYLYFELRCFIVGEFFFPAYPAERCALNGKVKVMVLTMCSQLMSCTRLHSEKDISETQYQSRAELGPMPTWVVRMVTGRVLGSGWERERVWPLFDVLADVETGAFGLVLAP